MTVLLRSVASLLSHRQRCPTRIFGQRHLLSTYQKKNTSPSREFKDAPSYFLATHKPSTAPWWSMLAGLVMFGIAWASVPLYKVFCQMTGLGGTAQQHKQYAPPPQNTEKHAKRLLTVDFVGTVAGTLSWEFQPEQKRIVVAPGETALAFYKAKNKSDKPLIGMSVYSVNPPETGIYFNKIQCFCFEEQLLNAGEEIDMPVFFFIDPDYVDDPRLSDIDNLTLSYVFFESNSTIPEEYRDLPFAQPTNKLPPGMSAI